MNLLNAMAEVADELTRDDPFWVDLVTTYEGGKGVTATFHTKGGVTMRHVRIKDLEIEAAGVIRGVNCKTHAKATIRMDDVAAYEIEAH